MKTKNIILIIVLAVIALGIGAFVKQHSLFAQVSAKQGHHEIWYCPMHPQILYDHPGRCPICGMDLVKKVSLPKEQGLAIDGYTTISLTAQKQHWLMSGLL